MSTHLHVSCLPSFCSCMNKLCRNTNTRNKCFFLKDRASEEFHVYFLGLHTENSHRVARRKDKFLSLTKAFYFCLPLLWLRSKTLYTHSGVKLSTWWDSSRKGCWNSLTQEIVLAGTSSYWVNGLLPGKLTLWDHRATLSGMNWEKGSICEGDSLKNPGFGEEEGRETSTSHSFQSVSLDSAPGSPQTGKDLNRALAELLER